jgi:cytochrome c556
MTINFKSIVVSILAVATLAITPVLLAHGHSGAKGIVKQRMDAMSDIGLRMKRLTGMVRGKTAFDPVRAKGHAVAIAKHARAIPGLFPEGSATGRSEAASAIWTDFRRFRAISRQLETHALALQSVAETAQDAAALRPLLGKIGGTCRSCHADFRISR